jgi:hypothetical protein
MSHYFASSKSVGLQFMKKGVLRVEEDIGAGLELFACKNGFLVKEVEDNPGQPDLQVKDVIVAIDGSILFGLEPEEVEKRFAAGFHNGADIIFAAGRCLFQLQLEEIQQATQHMLDSSPSRAEAVVSAPAINPGLCSFDADDGVEVSDDGSSVACITAQKTWSGIRGRPGILYGMYHFEVEVRDSCLLRVGFASISSRRSLGKDSRSFGYGGTGMKSHGGSFEPYGTEFEGQVGAVVTCLIDRQSKDNQTISFCLDGVNQGVAFDIPSEMVDIPLFPVVCGRGSWQATCRFDGLKFLQVGYELWNVAVQAGHAVVGPKEQTKPPPGIPVQEAHTAVRPGQRVTLYVVSGLWQGRHICEVLDTDALGCYLRHEDGFTETIPWMFLETRYRMELLDDPSVQCDVVSQCRGSDPHPSTSQLQMARTDFLTMQSLLSHVTDHLSEDVLEVIDAKLTPQQKTFIIWLSKGLKDPQGITTCSGGIAESRELNKWLEMLKLATHTIAISAWCNEQGAISLSEILENRDELISDLGTSLLPTESARILSSEADEAAEVATLHAQTDELTVLLENAVMELDQIVFDQILGALSHEQQTPLLSVWQRLQKHTTPAKSLSQKPNGIGAETTLNQRRVKVSSAASISKRDEKMLKNHIAPLSGQRAERCEGCKETMKAGDGHVCREDGHLYCGYCWEDWLRADGHSEAVAASSLWVVAGGA